MRLMFKTVLLAVVALALSGVAAAAASAHEWLLNGSPVKESTPVTHSATEFKIHRQEHGTAEEILTCALSGKGTVNTQGTGSITTWNLTNCTGSPIIPLGLKCEAGTLSVTAFNLPWATQLVTSEGTKVANDLPGGAHLTWQCKAKLFTESRLYKVTCNGAQVNLLTNEGAGKIKERWGLFPSPPMECERSFGTEKLETAGAFLVSPAQQIKAEKGELSFN